MRDVAAAEDTCVAGERSAAGMLVEDTVMEHTVEAEGLGNIEVAQRLAKGMEHVAEAVEQPKRTAGAEVVGIVQQAL